MREIATANLSLTLRDDWTLHVNNCVKPCRESSVLEGAVVEHKGKVSVEWKLATLCRLSGKFVNMLHPSFLRDPRWKTPASGVALFTSTSRRNFVAMTLSVLDPFVSSGGSGCCAALRNEHSSGVLRSGEFCEAFELVKPNAAAGRVNIATGCAQWWKGWLVVKMSTSGTGQSSTSVWSLRKAISRILVAGDRSPWSLLCSSCLRCACGRCWTRNSGLSTVRCVVFVQDGSVLASSHILWKDCVKQKNGAFSTDVASAFDAMRPELLGDAILSRGARSFLEQPW